MEDKLENLFTETDVEILISTMNQDSLDFLVPMFPFLHFSNFRILIINQTQFETILESEYPNIRVVNSFEKDLSKSRNLALENAQGKILVIADDDVIYQQGFVAKIINSYNQFPNAAAINFCAVKSDGSLMKEYPKHSKTNLNAFDIFNTSSIEMTLNKAVLDKTGIHFDEKFGLGGMFEMGEEAIFLFDLKSKKQQLIFESEVIVQHLELTSSSKKSIEEKYYIQGALYTRIFKSNYIYWIFVKLFFDLKQRKIRFGEFKSALKSSKKGHQKFETLQHDNKK
ncbi:glycosyltransferase family 2 protein [Flavobacterium piscisymbiosum]|uniref:Glycosyltransferase n=1 Tax=Flavobacterium piscisymbiosum TaxID=2893753 RepID=A0ABS8MEH1_9FLAO|nr:glycosyltransferase family A protein [Flavobacterium sp. F-30]MCC9063897.1 glycosyltransferase [Flavobacterium sp. F-30]